MNRYKIVIAWISNNKTATRELWADGYMDAIEKANPMLLNLKGDWYLKKIGTIAI